MITLQIEDDAARALPGSPSPENIPALADTDYLEQAAEAALSHSSPGQACDLAIVVSSDEALRALNQQYLGIDNPTDVLSFPAGDTDPDTGIIYLGDIILSYPRALAQAAAGGHPVQDEMQLLVVHGVLHLLGYDHAEPAEKELMWAAQAEVLGRLGLDDTALLAPHLR